MTTFVPEFCHTVILILFFLFFSYQYEWKIEEAKKNILRTHTTAVSSRMLYKLAKTVRDNSRLFVRVLADIVSISRCFLSLYSHRWWYSYRNWYSM